MLRRLGYCFSALVLLSTGSVADAEVELSGRLKVEGSEPPVMLAAVRVFGFPAGSERLRPGRPADLVGGGDGRALRGPLPPGGIDADQGTTRRP